MNLPQTYSPFPSRKAMPVYGLPAQKVTKYSSFSLRYKIVAIITVVVSELIALGKAYTEEPEIEQILCVVEEQQRQIITSKATFSRNLYTVEAFISAVISSGKAWEDTV